jgi:hypothetical protein
MKNYIEEKIPKEKIKEFKQLPIDKVETSLDSLISNLNMALKLGNTFKSKCKLVFNTTVGNKFVYATIWNVTNEHVELKGGTILLISAIIDIKLI